MSSGPGWLRLLISAVLASLILSACATRPALISSSAGDQRAFARAAALERFSGWSLSGRVALSDGRDGGSGRLSWEQHGESAELNFRAALGRGAWRLKMAPNTALLETGDGQRFQSPSVGYLVERYVGWPVPVDSLSYWIRGLPAPDRAAQVDWHQDGLPAVLKQAGWEVVFERWDRSSEPAMPTKLVARRDDYRVKLLIRSWALK